jgi:hypothetical protein
MVPINFAYPLSKESNFEETIPDKWMTRDIINFDLEKRPYIINIKQTGKRLVRSVRHARLVRQVR